MFFLLSPVILFVAVLLDTWAPLGQLPTEGNIHNMHWIGPPQATRRFRNPTHLTDGC